MAKKTIIDLKKTSNTIAPDSNYVRLKTNPDNSLQVIYSDGRTRTITHAWELPVEDYNETDPSLLTPSDWSKYIVPNGSIGDWTGHDQEIATWNSINLTWEFTVAEQGWGTYVKSFNQIYTFNGTEWSKLVASREAIEVTYDELRLLIRGRSLVPGSLYKMTDYQSYNQIFKNGGTIYTSPVTELLLEAIDNYRLMSNCVDLNNINDKIIYDPSMAVKGWFYQFKTRSNGSLVDDDYSFDDDYFWDWNNTPFLDIEFLSDTEVYLGLDTVLKAGDYCVCGDNGANTELMIGTDAIWDYNTGILTIVNGAVWNSGMSGVDYINLQGKFASPEFRKGQILQRHDLVNNIDCDFDWRNHQYGVYSAEVDFYNSGNPFYCSMHNYGITVQNPRLDASAGNTTRLLLDNINTNDYILKPFINVSSSSVIKNLLVRGAKYLIFEDCRIDNATFLKSNGAYFMNAQIYRSKFNNPSRLLTLPGATITDSEFTRLTSAVLYERISDSVLSVDRCLLRRVENTKLSLRHFAMNDISSVSSLSGSVGTVQINDNSHILASTVSFSNIIMQNASSISNSSLTGSFMRIMFDNTQITYSDMKTRSGEYNRYLYFQDRIIKELIWTGFMEGVVGAGNQVYFPIIDTSNIVGEIKEEAFPGMEIHANTITYNSGYILPSLNLNIEADVSSSVVNLELPANPYNGLEYTFIDVTGNAFINNIIVSISSSPSGGIINSINGQINKSIDENYGVLVLRYTSAGGWIVVQESVIQIDPTVTDDMTIEYIPSLGNLSTADTGDVAYSDSWYNGPPLAFGQTGISSSCSITNGTIYSRSNLIFYCYTNPVWPLPAVNNTPILEDGDYYLYSDIDLVPYDLCMQEDTRYAGYRKVYATSEKVNGLYRHKFDVNFGDFRLTRLNTDLYPPTGFFSRLVKKGGYPTSNVVLSSVNINNIVGADGFTFGTLTKKADDPNHEVPTRDYVDKTKNNVDNVTLESNLDVLNIITSQENDINEIMLDAFGHGITNAGWSFRGGATTTGTLVNGELKVNLIDDGSGFCEEYLDQFIETNNSSSSLPNTETWNLYIYSNFRDPSSLGGIWLVLDGYQEAAEIITLPNGNYLHRYVIFQGNANKFKGFRLRVPASTIPIADQPWFRMVSFDDYPPRNVIKLKEIDGIIDSTGNYNDGSSTPMSNPDREITTRGFTEDLLTANTQWNRVGDRLRPSDSTIEGLDLERNFNGYNRVTLRNTASGNGAGAVVELHKSNTAYQDNVYFGIYSDSFWLPFLAGNGALITDQHLIIGSVDNTKELRFIIGDNYNSPVQVGKIDTNGLSLESLKSTSINPSNFSNVMVNTDTGSLYANSDIMSGNNKQTDTFTLTALDITNGYVALSEIINISKHEMVNYNGGILFSGSGEDYTIDTINNRIVFTISQLINLYVGAKIQVKYYY